MPESTGPPEANPAGGATVNHDQGIGLDENPASEFQGWRTLFGLRAARARTSDEIPEVYPGREKPTKWSMGILNDKETNEVPGETTLLCIGS